jgi:propanol-preferring alcohol dehydrogenase
MSDIPSFPYSILWGERVIRSVANLTRRDGEELLSIAPKVQVQTDCTTLKFRYANKALDMLRTGAADGAIVLTMVPELTGRS